MPAPLAVLVLPEPDASFPPIVGRLIAMGVAVMTASTLDAALETARDLRPDAVVTSAPFEAPSTV